ncbi:MAG: hypothetical protein ACFE9N_11625 [Promethearchaeota archaeon]
MKVVINLKEFISNFKKIMLDKYLKKLKKVINLRKWIKSGKPLPGPHFYKQKVVKYYAKKFSPDIFIETGTYQGDMIHAIKKKFKTIYSIELNEELYRKARKRFAKYNHILIIYGDSKVQLKKILSKIDKPCLFWLDAHYSGDGTAKGDLETPIMEEMNLIVNHSNLEHIILIDDARLFIGENDYPSIEKVKNLVFKNHEDWLFIIKDDIIRIHSRD